MPVEVRPATREIVRDLQEIIAALDRRVPHLDRSGEREIARDAAELKAKAERRLAELMTAQD